ncbi:DUF4870 domain-containing protein [Wenyingzhuangia sp. 2_MG-2023]|uniref:DUF4870 domain-containing protein n=1 Tax=Wenyingzhuangia sp. 2_MG-2023 TaxID=3062639 RepID=UPI0026E3A8BF|nr:DUF4870 domain-containing protein [Wenyingzhuangia sp. 2_MG-2023]MDO6738266.1 DUF4870 domain-containing protein [Wenyingzhuangia sp. 2_MG-2023]MDO6802250.1 DUF4870 domain-containing protein [Wenyingzhuangia sp. 1_MG-2023]
MKKNSENTSAFLIHLSAFANYIFPFGGIIVPLILWQTKKSESNYLDEQGKEVVNFNISYLLYQFVFATISVLIVIFSFFKHIPFLEHLEHLDSINFEAFIEERHFIIPLFIFSICGFFATLKFILIITGALKAHKGEKYAYPFTISFIK